MMMIAMKVVSSVYMVITLQFYQPTVEKLHTQSSLPCQIDEWRDECMQAMDGLTKEERLLSDLL